MSEVSRILASIERGDPRATEQLLPLVYEELRRLAAERLTRERPDHSLQATALVHEAYLGSLVQRARNSGRAALISLRLLPRRCGGFSSTVLVIETGRSAKGVGSALI